MPLTILARAWGAGLLVCLLWDLTGLDMTVSHWFGDPSGFAWRDHWLLSNVMHAGAQDAMRVLFLLFVADSVRPFLPGPLPSVRRWGVLASFLGLMLVLMLKRTSLTSCPWDLSEFGGVATHVSHWAWGVADGGGAKCFPSGHSSSGFVLLGVAFFWSSAGHPWGRRVLLLSVAAGFAFSAVQVARGAHFVSHGLWSGWWMWTVALGLLVIRQGFFKRR